MGETKRKIKENKIQDIKNRKISKRSRENGQNTCKGNERGKKDSMVMKGGKKDLVVMKRKSKKSKKE